MNDLVIKDAVSLYNRLDNAQNFDMIRVGLASPEKILSWSYGSVKRAETVNYRTFKPERDGLFCARIFGPVRDYECLCGKYKRIKYKGIVCEKCGVLVTKSAVRRERMGHIDLASPVVHMWFMHVLPSKIGALLDMTIKNMEKVVYFDAHVVVDAGNTTMEVGQLLTENEYQDALYNFGEDTFKVMMGAEAIKHMLSQIDLKVEKEKAVAAINATRSSIKIKNLTKKLKIIEGFIQSGNRPEWMVLTRLPVLPPDIRPLVMLDGGRFAASDLNELYRRVINRNNRLKRLMDVDAPEIIIRNEKRMLQEAVDALLDNSRKDKPSKNSSGRAFKSLSDMLKGKQGRFRQNLLGKRVDYSGRSVIVVGPELKLHQCGLPKEMAIELFKPFIYFKLELYGIVGSVKTAKKYIDERRPEVMQALEEIIRDYPVLLNRAPTLHRLGIQAFEPKLIETKAIQLHPLVCSAFNADFDGDQMAVHIPLSIESQMEARVLMLSTNNILSPASGKPVITPTQDIVLGLYYMTTDFNGEPGEGLAFDSLNQLETALLHKQITINTKIKYRFKYTEAANAEERKKSHIVETTPGRVKTFSLVPADGKMKFEQFNASLTKKSISSLLDQIYKVYGQRTTVLFADKMMQFGFNFASRSGISFGKDDIVIPSSKESHVSKAFEIIKEHEKQYLSGFVTSREKYNKVTDVWLDCTEKVTKDMTKELSNDHDNRKVNSIYTMIYSGARGSETQMKQLAGMRGLMTKPSGEIIETPIVSNFKDGLTVIEYFNSAHGARKGLADTALKTADSGYLTRRLVDVAQNCIITELDCGTSEFIHIKPVVEGARIVVPFSELVIGRTVAEDIKDNAGKNLIKKGEVITHEVAKQLDTLEIAQISVRSVVTCETETGVCAKCYGASLATGKLVELGEAVGIMAAQSIGEPGTQLTMRTFQIGGVASRNIEKSSAEADFAGIVKFINLHTVTNRKSEILLVSNNCSYQIVDEVSGKVKAIQQLSYGAKLSVKDGEKVTKGQLLAKWDPYNIPIISEFSGKIAYSDLVNGVSYREVVDEETGVSSKTVIEFVSSAKQPSLKIVDKAGNPVQVKKDIDAEYNLAVNAVILVDDKSDVEVGDVIARVLKESGKAIGDITGGLPRVEELFEARKPKDPSLIAEIDGTIDFLGDYKSKKKIAILPDNKEGNSAEYLIPKGRHVRVREGSNVRKGDIILDGNPDPHDILRVNGTNALVDYMIHEIQSVYRLQGQKIDDKHIEVIIKYMIQKVAITNPGDTGFIMGSEINKRDLLVKNKEALKKKKRPAEYSQILHGITKSSLYTDSFISSASFQETTKVLTEAAIFGRVDYLRGPKESVIIGRLIPAGTGFITRNMARTADKK